jgi:hypothetical protein
MIEGWSVVARRDDAVLTVTWFEETAIGAIGWHSMSSSSRPVRNQASARRIIKPEDLHASPNFGPRSALAGRRSLRSLRALAAHQ